MATKRLSKTVKLQEKFSSTDSILQQGSIVLGTYEFYASTILGSLAFKRQFSK